MSGFDTAAFVFFVELLVYGSIVIVLWDGERRRDWDIVAYTWKYVYPIPFIYLAFCLIYPKATP